MKSKYTELSLRLVATLTIMAFFILDGLYGQSTSIPNDTLVVEGIKRSFRLYIPDVVADRPALVLVFHGSDADASQPKIFGFERHANSEGFILAYPNGFERHWNDCRRAGSYSTNVRGVDDVEFMRHLVAHLADRFGIDTTKVFATGWSNGGQFAYRLALESPDLVAAIAPFCANLPAEDNLDCTPTNQPVSVLIMNGTQDLINPWEGGSSPHGNVLSAEETFVYWANVANLRGEATITRFPNVVTDDESNIELHTLSSEDVEVSLLIVKGGGHTLPGPLMQGGGRLGAVNRDIDGAEFIWKFFSRHQLKKK